MKKLIEYIKEAEKEGIALGHFNFSNIEALWSIFRSAKSLEARAVLVGVSEGERKFFGVRQARAVVDSLKAEFDYPIFLSADHTYSLEGVKEVVDAGYDAVVVDGSKLSLDDNIELTKQAVLYAKDKNSDILVEGELGYIGTSSKVLEDIPEGVNLHDALVTGEIAKRFVEETKVDLLSPAVGNLHGMFKGRDNPEIDIERIKEIRKEADIPLVLHGGSGITDDDFKKAITAGVSIVHVNTEIRLAYKRGLEKSLEENPDEVAPYRLLKPAVSEMEKIITENLKLFSNK